MVAFGHPVSEAAASQFAACAKKAQLILRVVYVECDLHFTGRRGNSALGNSHPAHPKIM